MEGLSADQIALMLNSMNPQMNFEIVNTAPQNTENSITDERFKQVIESDIDNFLENNENRNTKKKTESDLNLFNIYLHSQGIEMFPEFMPPPVLNSHICAFLLAVRKKNGEEFEPSTLRSFMSSIDRHLRKKNYGVSLITDIAFEKSRTVLRMKQKQVKSLGKGNKPKAADALSDEDLEKMYQAKTLGRDNPIALINSMWLLCTLHFGLRTGKETHSLQWGDVTLKVDSSNGSEYLLYDTERQTKTRTGANPRDIRQTNPRAYALPTCPNKDPVELYKLYRAHRPDDLNSPDSPFFLTVNTPNPKPGQCWFKKLPMGINKMYAIMKGMMKDTVLTSIDKRITPYSARKHLVQKLNDQGIPPHQIVQISGHKNINSLNNYSKLNPQQSMNISRILSNAPCTALEVEHSETSVIQPLRSLPPPSVPSSTVTRDEQSVPPQLSGFFQNATVNGNIHINFQQASEKSLSQSTFNVQVGGSPPSPPRKWRRILPLQSDDSE